MTSAATSSTGARTCCRAATRGRSTRSASRSPIGTPGSRRRATSGWLGPAPRSRSRTRCGWSRSCERARRHRCGHPSRLCAARGREPGQRGQGLVEFSALVPVFLLLLLGMLEFGFVFDQNLTLEYATREGARVGSALANDGGALGCVPATTKGRRGPPDPRSCPARASVAGFAGEPARRDAGPDLEGQLERRSDLGDDEYLEVHWAGTGTDLSTGPVGRRPADRLHPSHAELERVQPDSTAPRVDSIGVSMTHTYSFQTPLAGILRFFGGASAGTLTMSDKTVMALNPTN